MEGLGSQFWAGTGIEAPLLASDCPGPCGAGEVRPWRAGDFVRPHSVPASLQRAVVSAANLQVSQREARGLEMGVCVCVEGDCLFKSKLG